MIQIINSFSEIIDKYDIFILDQWGVMHDGHHGYKHSIDAVKHLINNNKKISILNKFNYLKK